MSDTTIWITGATSGIGKALAQNVPYAGARIINLSRRKHPDFVATGYFHDKYPNRLCITSKNSESKDPSQQSPQQGAQSRDKTAARSNAVQKPEGDSQ